MSDTQKLVIIGSGPAGWTAAIYAARATLDPLILEGVPKQEGGYVLPGGQLMLTTEVENYPGYPEGVDGPKMMDDFKKQAQRFDTRIEGRDVVKCDFSKRPYVLETKDSGGNEKTVTAQSVIIATGAVKRIDHAIGKGQRAAGKECLSRCAVGRAIRFEKHRMNRAERPVENIKRIAITLRESSAVAEGHTGRRTRADVDN